MPRVSKSQAAPKILDEDLLWKKDPHLRTLTKTKARPVVQRRIRNVVDSIVGSPPAKKRPHHLNHPVGVPKVSYGTQTGYKRIGSFFSRCDPIVDEFCYSNPRYFRPHLPEEYLLAHDQLTPLLLMREELKVQHRSTTVVVDRLSITSSALYMHAFEKYYPASFRAHVQREPILRQETPALSPRRVLRSTFPTPPPTLERLEGSSRALSGGQRASASLDRVESTHGPSEIIELTDSESEDLDDNESFPIWLIFWCKDNVRPASFLLFPPQRDFFCLSQHKAELGERNLEQTGAIGSLEIYNRKHSEWCPLLWSTRIGPLLSAGQTFLIRTAGTGKLLRFDCVLPMASHIPKGKGRA